MTKQLSLYEKLTDTASRDIWRDKSKSGAKTGRSTYKIPFSKVVILDGWNTRDVFEGIEELAEDMAINGMNVPLEGDLSSDGKHFYVTDGERRVRAIKLLAKRKDQKEIWKEVEVIPNPRNMSVEDKIVRMLSGGVQKSLYKDVEIANGLFRLKNDFELSNEHIAGKMGKSRQWVDNMIKLAKQPEKVKDAINEGKTTKTAVIAPMKDKVTDVAAGMIKPGITPGLPPSLKTDNAKAEKQETEVPAAAGDPVTITITQENHTSPAVEVSGKDALQKVNYDRQENEQEAAINRIAKNCNKIEGLGKGLNEQGQKDLDTYLGYIRKDVDELKTYYSKFKNRAVI